MKTIQQNSEDMRHEAKTRLNRLMKIPEGYGSGEVERFVDCIIGAAILEMSYIYSEASKHNSTSENR